MIASMNKIIEMNQNTGLQVVEPAHSVRDIVQNYFTFFRSKLPRSSSRSRTHKLTPEDKCDAYRCKYYHGRSSQLRQRTSEKGLTGNFSLGSVYHISQEFQLPKDLQGRELQLQALCKLVPLFAPDIGPEHFLPTEPRTCQICYKEKLVYKYEAIYTNYLGKQKRIRIGINCASLLNAIKQGRLVQEVYPEMVQIQRLFAQNH